MTRVYEFTTWKTGEAWDKLNAAAVSAGKAHNGMKFTVSIGQWGTRSFLVFADTKEEAKALAVEFAKHNESSAVDFTKIVCRDVTTSKRYN